MGTNEQSGQQWSTGMLNFLSKKNKAFYSLSTHFRKELKKKINKLAQPFKNLLLEVVLKLFQKHAIGTFDYIINRLLRFLHKNDSFLHLKPEKPKFFCVQKRTYQISFMIKSDVFEHTDALLRLKPKMTTLWYVL